MRNLYRNIYSSKADYDNSRINDLFFGNTSSKSVNLEEKEKCEGMLTKAECLQALKSMKPEKTPGSDGLPIEFYKAFWNEISDCLLNAINYPDTEGKFSISQRRGIIKLIPKSKAPSSYLMVCGNYCMKCCSLCLVELSTIWKINVYLMSPSNDFTLLFPNRYQRKVFSRLKKVISTAPNFILFQFRSCDDTLRRFFSEVPNSNSNFSFKFKEIHRKMTE